MPSPTMGPVIRRMWDQSLTIKGNLSNHNVRFAPHRHYPICLNASGSLGSFTVLCTSTSANRTARLTFERSSASPVQDSSTPQTRLLLTYVTQRRCLFVSRFCLPIRLPSCLLIHHLFRLLFHFRFVFYFIFPFPGL